MSDLIGRYSSMEDYLDALRAPIANERNRGDRETFNGRRERSWYGMTHADGDTTIANMIHLASAGWTRGVNNMMPLLGKLDVPRMESVKRRRVRGDRGDQIDMGRVYAGELDTAWSRVARRSVVSPYRVIIGLDTIAHAGQDAERMFWRNAASVALSDLLSQAGYRVKVIAGFEGSNNRRRISCQVIVKDYNQPWSLSNAAIAAMPGFFRGIGHYWYQNASKVSNGATGMHVGEMRAHHIEDKDAPHVFVPPPAVSDIRSAEAWIKGCIEKIGRPVIHE